MIPDNLFLIGLMGSGKSTVGRSLAKKLHKQFIDTDEAIEQKSGVSIQVIFDIEGEEGFRQRETQMLDELTHQRGIVIATGGGAVIKPENRKILRERGYVIYLQASADDLYQRIHKDTSRPLLKTANPRETLRRLLAERAAFYEETADYVCNTTNRERYYTVVNKIIRYLRQ
jgi:shikimate kinase